MLSITLYAHAFVAAPAASLTRDAASPRMTAHWMDHLKFGGTTPAFDVVEKTKEYVLLGGHRGERRRRDGLPRGRLCVPRLHRRVIP